MTDSLSHQVLNDELDAEAIDLPEEAAEDEEVPEWDQFSSSSVTKRNNLAFGDVISDIAKDLSTRFMTDTGDIKTGLFEVETILSELVGASTKCTSKRVRNLSRAWRNVVKAAGSGNVDKIVDASHAFRKIAKRRSRMYNRCYKHMRKTSKDLAFVADAALRIYVISA